MNTNIAIGPGWMVVYGGSVYINVSEIGSNFNVYHDVTNGVNRMLEIPIVKIM